MTIRVFQESILRKFLIVVDATNKITLPRGYVSVDIHERTICIKPQDKKSSHYFNIATKVDMTTSNSLGSEDLSVVIDDGTRLDLSFFPTGSRNHIINEINTIVQNLPQPQ